MKRIFLLLLLVISCGPTISAQAQKMSKRDGQLMREVRAVLDAQVEAWNRGDIEGFMKGYWQSTETIFVSGDTVTRGWQTVLDRYKKSYDSREKMGVLTFSELEIKPLGKESAMVLGRWQLRRAQDNPHGRFTLLFRRLPEGWRIVLDHTS
jgi:ketosteroid isomerase-like protein